MTDKQTIRERVWDRLEADGVARFPFPPHGRIPNFAGARDAAERLASLEWWAEADVLKCNPDAPQRPVRARALADDIAVVMARPRLRDERPFLILDPESIPDPSEAATIGGASEHGRALLPGDVPEVDAVVVGSVAVDRSGRRVGKGEGYSDLEFALLHELGCLETEVTIATTVHPIQLREEQLPTDDHDVALDFIAMPETVLRAYDRPDRPTAIDWDRIDEARLGQMPAVEAIRTDTTESDAVS